MRQPSPGAPGRRPQRSPGGRQPQHAAPPRRPGSSADDPDQDDVLGESLCGIGDFVRYLGYDGPLDVGGKMWIRTLPRARQSLTYRLHGVDPGCSSGPGEAANSCGVQVHEGTSCSTDTLRTLYDREARSRDPWARVAYTAVTLSDGSVAAGARSQPVETGVSRHDVRGRVVVVYNVEGMPVACAPITGFYAGRPPSTQALPMFEVDDFESYGGYGLKGSLVLDLKPGLTDAASGFHLSYRLQGVDPECSKGPGDETHSCGLLISTSTSCGGPVASLFNGTAILQDPWEAAGYTALTAHGKTTAIGGHVPVNFGLAPEAALGHAVYVLDRAGSAIACGIAA